MTSRLIELKVAVTVSLLRNLGNWQTGLFFSYSLSWDLIMWICALLITSDTLNLIFLMIMAPTFTSLKFTCAHQHKHLSCGGGVTIWVDVDSSVRPSVQSESRAQRAVHESMLQTSVKWRVEHNSSTTIWETDEENQNFQLLLLKKALVVWTKKKLFFKWLYANKRNVRSLFAGQPGSFTVAAAFVC